MAHRLVLICGESTSGKSTSLANLKNQAGVLYLGTESNKDLPFKNDFVKIVGGITHPEVIIQAAKKAEENDSIHTIIVDSLTFLMELYESVVVLRSDDTRGAWSEYQQFMKRLMQEVVGPSNKNWIFTAHLWAELKPDGSYRYSVPVKGALKNNGLEAYFNNIVYCRKISLNEIPEKHDNSFINITNRDKNTGYKHVFQVEVDKAMVDSRIRAPLNCFAEKLTFMDNDIQQYIDILDNFYGDESRDSKNVTNEED